MFSICNNIWNNQQRVTNIKPFINNCNWEGIDFEYKLKIGKDLRII